MTEAEQFSYYDSHAHYTDAAYGDAAQAEALSGVEALRRMRRIGIQYVLTAGVDLASSEAACGLSARLGSLTSAEKEDVPTLYAAVGIHPLYVRESVPDKPDLPSVSGEGATAVPDKPDTPQRGWRDEIDALRGLAKRPVVVAIGEIGLDYRRQRCAPEERPSQRELLDAQLSLCEELRLPAVIHSIDAAADTLDILTAHPGVCGVMHGYTYSMEFARRCVAAGYRIGIGPILLRPGVRRIREVAAALPLESLVMESDSPYQYSDSACLPLLAEEIAALRGTTPEAVACATCRNASALFLGSTMG